MKSALAILLCLGILIAGCKKDDSLVGKTMSVTKTGTALQFGEVNIFSPDGNGLDDHFHGPVYLRAVPDDSVTASTLKIFRGSDLIANNPRWGWDGLDLSGHACAEGLYIYDAAYTTVNGSATAHGLVRLWKHGKVPCSELSILKFEYEYSVQADTFKFENLNLEQPLCQ